MNKSKNETKLVDILTGLTLSFPQLDTLVDVYPSVSLEKAVASVYREVIFFVRDAAQYYTRFSGVFISLVYA